MAIEIALKPVSTVFQKRQGILMDCAIVAHSFQDQSPGFIVVYVRFVLKSDQFDGG